MAQECDEVRKNRRRIGRLPFRLSTIRFQKNGMLVCCFSEAPEYLILSDLARRLRRKKAQGKPLVGLPWAFIKAHGFYFLSPHFFAELAAQEAVEADGNEGDAEDLSLVEPDGVDHLDFPCFLNVFEKLDEEAEGEDGR